MLRTAVAGLLLGLGVLPGPARAQSAGLTVTWADDSDSDVTLDPRVTQSRHEEQVIVQLYDQLLAADETGKLYPGLAKSWEVSADGRSVVLHLREDVKFHDGTPFNAEAVKFNLDSIVDPALGSQGAIDILGPYAGAEVLGPYDIRISYKRAFAGALDALADDRLSVVSPTAVKTLGNNGFAQHPVGTGPFRFVSWEKNAKVEMVRNDDYRWAPSFMKQQGPSQVARLVHRYIPAASTRVAALEAGEVDATDVTPPLDMKRLSETGKFKTTVGVASGLPLGYLLNTSHGPFADAAVRKAFFQAIDRPTLTQNLFFGYAKASFGPLSSSTLNYWPGVEQTYPFDRAAAGKLLDGAGWTVGTNGIRQKDGQPLSVYLPALLEPDTAVALQAAAKRVGIDVKVENVTKARQDELIFANGYDLLPVRWVSNDPSVLEIPFHSRNVPEPGRFKFNWARYKDPELDKLLESAASAATPAEREAIYGRAQAYIMDKATFLPVHDQVQTVAYNARIDGLRFVRGQWQVRFYEAHSAK